jgi:hypothetical protein
MERSRRGNAGPALMMSTAHAADVGVTAKKLVVIDKLVAAGKAKTVFVSKDAGATKGDGTDPDEVGVVFDFFYAGEAGATGGQFILAPGASDGTDGWVVNKPTVAKYVNKASPDGATGAKVGVRQARKAPQADRQVARRRTDRPRRDGGARLRSLRRLYRHQRRRDDETLHGVLRGDDELQARRGRHGPEARRRRTGPRTSGASPARAGSPTTSSTVVRPPRPRRRPSCRRAATACSTPARAATTATPRTATPVRTPASSNPARPSSGPRCRPSVLRLARRPHRRPRDPGRLPRGLVNYTSASPITGVTGLFPPQNFGHALLVVRAAATGIDPQDILLMRFRACEGHRP